MSWQSAIIVLLAAALASVDLSALVSMTSEPAADLVLSLAASQTGLAALWCAAGGGSVLVRLAVAGLVVNSWSTALGPFSHEMATVLLSELAIILVAGMAWRLWSAHGSALDALGNSAARRPPRFSLADMLALTVVLGLVMGPLPALVPGSGAAELKLLGAALACQVLAVGWGMLGAGRRPTGWTVAIAATVLSAMASEHVLRSPERAVRSALLTAGMTAAMLMVVRVCGMATMPSRNLRSAKT